ncbi:hypothetical protein X752_27080 [Mesorhizobium sp. LNJC398B00]|nr:hypothetical protein X752_27080 [Mesorhizobium sp. LNJC398B00]
MASEWERKREEATVRLISPLLGEMPGRAEGGSKECDAPDLHASARILSEEELVRPS